MVRDMFQNHLLQLMCLTAMEPPVAFQADAVRDEKTKVLRAIRRVPAAEMHDHSVRGQYGPGTIEGVKVPGYRQEPDVDPASNTATWGSLRLLVDNWRWHGVPFFLRSGKRMARRVTEIAVQFREPPHLMFPLDRGQTIAPNVIAIRVQPQEGISLAFDIKVPGVGVRMTAARMDFSYAEAFGQAAHSAYETLLLDCMVGDATLFTRADARGGRLGGGRSGDRGMARPPRSSPTMRRGAGGRRPRTSSSRATAPAGDSRDGGVAGPDRAPRRRAAGGRPRTRRDAGGARLGGDRQCRGT